MSLQELAWPRHTRRLTVRPVTVEDAPALWAWHRLPEVSRWASRLNDDLEKYTAHVAEAQDRMLVATIDDHLVAVAKVDIQDAWGQAEVAEQAVGTMAEIGWAVDPVWQRQGLATELAAELLAICFNQLGLRRVVAECFAENAASAVIMERIGMRREAHHLADALHRDGTWRDSYIYAVLASQWFARQAATGTD